MPNLVTLIIIVLSIACAYLSWKFIEQPFRNKGILKRNQVLLGSVFALGCLALFSNVAAYGNFGDNRTTMAGHTTKWLEDIQKANFGLDRNCNRLEEIQSGKCSIGRESEYILWGDSYAMHLAQAIIAGGDPFTQLTMSACHPIIGMAPFSPVPGKTSGDLEWGNRCQDYNDMALNYILENQTDKIIISSPFGSLTDTDVSLNVRGNLLETEVARPTDAFLATLNMLLRNDKQVVIVSPMPRPPYAVADCIIRSSFLGKSFDECNFPRSLDRQQDTYDALQKVSDTTGVPVVYLRDFVCDEKQCKVDISGTPLYRDSSHMSPSGSFALGQHTGFLKAVERAFQTYDLAEK